MLSLLFICRGLSAADATSEAQWFVGLAKANNGKAFCAPPTTTVKELVDAVRTFMDAHPELNDRANDEQTLRALAEHYPCKAPAASGSAHPDTNSEAQTIASYRDKGASIQLDRPHIRPASLSIDSQRLSADASLCR
jgi:hypothetical protein